VYTIWLISFSRCWLIARLEYTIVHLSIAFVGVLHSFASLTVDFCIAESSSKHDGGDGAHGEGGTLAHFST
jgi:hypothetical protein